MARTKASEDPKAQEKSASSLPPKPTSLKPRIKQTVGASSLMILEPSPKRARSGRLREVAKKGKVVTSSPREFHSMDSRASSQAPILPPLSPSQARAPSPTPSISILKTPMKGRKKKSEVKESFVPPLDYTTAPLQVFYINKFKKEFENHSFYPVVAVDLEELKNKFKVDLDFCLGFYKPWLEVQLSYSRRVVRVFYCNMGIETTHKDNREIIKEEL